MKPCRGFTRRHILMKKKKLYGAVQRHPSRSRCFLLDEIDDLFISGKTALIFLGEDHLVVDGDIEYTTTALDEFCLDPKRVPQCGRQTGGLR